MENERLVLEKLKEYLIKEIAFLKKQEDKYNEAAKEKKIKDIRVSCKQEVRAELECLQDIMKTWEGI